MYGLKTCHKMRRAYTRAMQERWLVCWTDGLHGMHRRALCARSPVAAPMCAQAATRMPMPQQVLFSIVSKVLSILVCVV